jgi:hypothetical protein
MKVQIKKTFRWAHSQSDIRTYSEGDEYELDDEMAQRAIKNGWCSSLENKNLGSAAENKAKPKPRKKSANTKRANNSSSE